MTYISVVQQPARRKAGAAFAGRFFAPIYRGASVLQVGAVLIGTTGEAVAWHRGGAGIVRAALLFAVLPFTWSSSGEALDSCTLEGPLMTVRVD